jgi:hypothetical protein
VADLTILTHKFNIQDLTSINIGFRYKYGRVSANFHQILQRCDPSFSATDFLAAFLTDASLTSATEHPITLLKLLNLDGDGEMFIIS